MDKLLVKILPINYTQSFTGKTCSPLLCYRFVSTTLAAQIPSGNAIANSLGLLHAETGFSYFGARYYDSDLMTGWLSVDPMADKYPSLSPYAYCAWNPVRLVDLDGRMLDEWNVNIQTGEYILVGERVRNSGTDYYNIVDSYGGYYGTYIGSSSKDYSITMTNGTDCYGNTFFDIKTQNMDFGPFHPGMGDNSFSEVPSSGQLSNSLDLWGNTKYATTAIGGFTGVQNVLIENLAAGGSDVSKSLGKAASVYNSTIKGIGIAGTITTITASGKQFYDYYNNGGTKLLVGAKLALDAGMSLVSNIGPIVVGIGFAYSMIDVCTGGFGTNKELNKYMK
jgi:RHS repeat-associated protein